jgi:hypothetical protein
MMAGKAVPRDWTLGTGVIPTSGTITVSAEPDRNSIFIQSIGSSSLSVVFPATEPGTGPADTSDTFETSTFVTLTVAPGSGTNYGREILALSTQTGFCTTSAFTVVGTAGSAVCVLTN